jgi:hypothetical protein
MRNLHAIYEQIERTAWLNYYLNLWQLPQLTRDFTIECCKRYCPDWTEETAREVFNRENKKLAEMQEADKASRNDDPDPAYAEYQHIKEQWANRPEANY